MFVPDWSIPLVGFLRHVTCILNLSLLMYVCG